ncbi:tautomerase family protein [Acinetobacter sp. MD2]|uniref:tautomerase family protein n=1 Tax=Acinetobacter sp. MD2 TaxID=2600066 RepID=UPI002D1E5DD3|nr:tautomerase family protein [Acinetobacter sp. MD2]MEB3767493.1 tautomerase family protein [Acinetobacter sp. MD2]
MSQIKIYGLKATLAQFREKISDAVHSALVDALAYPADKKFQRFIALDAEDFIYPKDRTDQYLIIELSMFEGRSNLAKKKLIELIFQNIETSCGIAPHSVEITIFETPKENWGIRGQHAPDLALNYTVAV